MKKYKKVICAHVCVSNKKIQIYLLNPHAPVAQKIADEVVFRRFQGEGVEPSDF